MAHSHTAVSTWLTCTLIVSTQCFFHIRTLFGRLTLLFTSTFTISLIPLSNLHTCASLHSCRLNTAVIRSLLAQPFALFNCLRSFN
ncbi:hypothetical protein FB446DRAFT_741233 [Lentinula raphanica]|nr:hypothetical protein FB446DRAFT_741233 [Lentinula raphanica]